MTAALLRPVNNIIHAAKTRHQQRLEDFTRRIYKNHHAAERQPYEESTDFFDTAGAPFSPHAALNSFRRENGVSSLRRNRDLDEFARDHAAVMARKGTLVHAVETTKDLQIQLQARHVATNIRRGRSLRRALKAQSRDVQALPTILSRKFTEFGVGTAVGRDGKVYLCQVFRGIY